MAIQILDSGLEIYFRIGNTIKEVAKEGIGVNEWSPDAGQGVWVVPERGTKEFSIAVADVNNPGGLTTSSELREYILSLASNVPGGGGGIVEVKGADASAENTLPTSVTSAVLFAARDKRVDITLRNGTNQLADVKRDGAAVSGTEALQLQPGEETTITGWEGELQVIFAAVGTGTFYGEETYIS